MKCPYCKSEDVKVIDTRKYDTCVLRVRFCETCRCAFQTEEQIHLMTPIQITHISAPNS